MKKLIAIFISISITYGALAQMGKVISALSYIDQGLLDKAKEALDQALVNEKSKNNPKTWVAKGRLAQECFRSDNAKFKAFYADPLEEALAAYEKALELDPKGTIDKQLKLNNTYVLLGNDFITQGVQRFEAQDFAGALKSFENNIKVATSPLYIGVPDTGIYFNAGLAAYNAKMYDRAIVHFQKCADLKYEGPMPYFLIYSCYKEMNDLANAEATLKKAFELYPNNQDVILNLVDFYMTTDKLDEAFSYLNMAKSQKENDYTLYWAEGVLYMKQEKYDEAIASLKKSIELKGDEYNTQFNLGVCFYNKAVAMFQKANEIMDVAKYNAAIAEANAVFIQAVPYFEKAAELKKDDPDSLRNLKELYFRLRTVNPEFEAKYNEVVKKLEQIQ
ncbi:MAG: tetratricopeptide repeat protein [Bacteroidales bacterium]